MKIVIDIPEKVYGLLRYFEEGLGLTDKINSNDDVKTALMRAVIHGEVLPKGHGRLKDIDKIEWYGCTTELDCPHKDQECKDCNRAECSKTQVDAIPTIIEADKESEQ